MRRSAAILSKILFLSWSNLSDSPGRFALSIGTVSAAALLMFTQLGFLDASLDSQARIVARAHPDVVVISRARPSLISEIRFPLQRLVQLRALPGVRDAVPMYLDSRRFRLRNPQNGKRLLVRVIAVDPVQGPFPVFRRSGADGADTLLVDSRSKPLIGIFDPGSEVELEGRTFRMRGFFRLGSDFVNDGNILMTSRNLLHLLPPDEAAARLDHVDVGLVNIEPGSSVDGILQEARLRLPHDVEVLTLQGFLGKEREFWRDHTIVGFVFTLGTLVGLLVGTVICAQLLYSIVWDFRRQFATLSAIGFQRSFIIGTVISKSLILAACGFLLAWVTAYALYVELSVLTGLTFGMSLDRCLLVLGLTVLMTSIAALAAARPLLREDPADLFKD
jgi:putative ABC transport system permease protein